MSDIKDSEKLDYKKNLEEDLYHYRTILQFMEANVPIEVLCLPKPIENILIRDGCNRVYDLISRDLTKIKGIGDIRLDLLTSRLDQFFSVSL